MTNLSISPYYDDFDETKQYHQILFRPGFSVQARELTQLQTYIQNQISRFGNHIFRDGAMVFGGKVSFNARPIYYTVSGIVPSAVFGDLSSEWYIANGTFIARVLLSTDSPASVYAQIISGVAVASGSTVSVYDKANYTLLVTGGTPVATTTCTVTSTAEYRSLANVDAGVTYINGRFVYHEAQTIALGANPVTITVGFEVVESVITAFDDSSLLDPAIGSSNYAAPGADRLAVTLTLATRAWDGSNYIPATSTDFVELMRVKLGILQTSRKVPIYSDIMDTMARRTYDESGDYVTTEFSASSDIGLIGDASAIVTVSAGKAYVKGYEVDVPVPVMLDVLKARTLDGAQGLNRIDKIVLMTTGEFRVIQGTPAYPDPLPPADLANALTLFEVYVKYDTNSSTDFIIKRINHRVYTMKDIGTLDKRIGTLEYYTQLSLLENETANKNIYDAAGNSLFMNGFLVDSFTSYQVGDFSPGSEMRATVNTTVKILQPNIVVQPVELEWSTSSTAAKYQSVAMIPPVSTEIFLTQTQSSHIVNINPFSVIRNPGNLVLEPSSDVWAEFETTTTTNYVEGGGTVGSTTTFASGSTQQTLSSWGAVSNGANQSTTETSRFVQSSTTTSIPWIRPRTVHFTLSGVKPNTRMYIIFDGQEITDLATPAEIVTNTGGYATGTFNIPNTSTRRFPTGNSTVFLADINNVQDYNHDTSYASAQYVTKGTFTQQDVRVTMRRDTTIINSWVPIQIAFPTVWVGGGGGCNDPTAQTFTVPNNLYKNGLFLTSLTVFFSRKDASKPVWCQLRPTVNGYPDSSVVHPYSTVTLFPADIQVSTDTLTPTEFVFPVPVHLPPGEHSFVILSDSDNYEIHTAQNGGYDRVTQKRILTQPYIGSLFASQNSSTWTPDQWADVSFILKKAVFPIGTAYNAVLNNKATTAFEYGRLNVPLMDIQFGGQDIANTPAGVVTYSVTTKELDNSLTTQAVNSASDVYFDSVKHLEASTTNDVQLSISLLTNQRDISPLVDLDRGLMIAGDWVINNDVTNETNYAGGNAIAKYVTNSVTLNEGLDGTDILVTCATNRIKGTDVKIYYKVLHASDSTIFSNRPWVEITRKAKTYDVALKGEYIEDEYVASNISYISTTGATLVGFKTYAIKVVMLSSSKCFAPTLSNLRVMVAS